MIVDARAGCPDDDVVHAVLERTAPADVDASSREHVAKCDACLARHGAAFEIELWAPGLGSAPHVDAPPLTWPRALERIAVAAVLVALAWFAAQIPMARDADSSGAAEAELASDCRVLALELSEATSGPDGSVVIRRVFDPGNARRRASALVRVEEIRTGRDGVAVVHERFLPHGAADRE